MFDIGDVVVRENIEWNIDERESYVMGAASRTALTVNYVMGLLLSVVLMALGWVAFSILVLVMAIIPHLVAAVASKRRGVDLYAVAGRQDDRIWVRSGVILFIFVVAIAAVAGYAGLRGVPLIPGYFSAEITERMESFLTGFGAGGIVGGIAGIWAASRAARQAAAGEEAGDEE